MLISDITTSESCLGFNTTEGVEKEGGERNREGVRERERGREIEIEREEEEER